MNNEFDFPKPIEIESEELLLEQEAKEFGYQLRDEQVGGRVVRGGAVRVVGYGIGSVAIAISSVFLLRYLGVSEFGKYAAVMSLITIIAGVTDAGLTTVGNRELAVCETQEERRRLIGVLFGIRLVLTPLGVLAAVAFAVLAGYPQELIWGTAIAGLGVTLMNISSALSLTLAVDMQLGRLTVLDVIKQVAPTIVALALVVAGAALLPFFAMAIPGAILALVLLPWLVGRSSLSWPTFDFRRWLPLLKIALPVAISTMIATLYIRILTVLMFELSNDFETGLFGTSVRIVELFFAIPWIVFTVALPVLSVSSREDLERLSYVFQRMIDVSFILGGAVAIGLCLGAEMIITLAGGSAYDGAIPVLQLQAFAVIGAFVSQASMFVAVAMNLMKELVVANVIGLIAIIAIGIPLISTWDAEGAAVAALIADTFIAIVYLVILGRASEALRPSLRATWKPALATTLAMLVGFGSGLPSGFAVSIGLIVFAVVIIATRAMPSEVVDALKSRRAQRG